LPLGSLISSNILKKKKEKHYFAFKKQRGGRDKNLRWEEAEEASLYCKKKRHITEDKEKQLKANN
jgi:hypothetical protein